MSASKIPGKFDPVSISSGFESSRLLSLHAPVHGPQLLESSRKLNGNNLAPFSPVAAKL